MEPIKVWEIWIDGPQYTDDEKIARQYSDNPREGVFVPRADFDALVKRDQTCPLCGDELDPDEADYESVCPPAGAGVCSRCFARWHDAPVYEKRAAAATARADKAEALLRRVRAATRHRDQNTCDVPHALSREIDAQLAAKGQAAPTPADPTNPAPAATSGAGCTEQKEP